MGLQTETDGKMIVEESKFRIKLIIYSKRV